MRVTEDLLTKQHGQVVRLVDRSGCRQIRNVDRARIEPFAVGFFRGYFLLQFAVVHDPALSGIDEKHLARLKAAFHHDLFRIDIEHAHFRRHDHDVVL